MKIYIALCKDRHMDEITKPFRNKLDAIQFCKDFMKRNKNKYSSIEEEKIEGWEYYAVYSHEGGDSVRVTMEELE